MEEECNDHLTIGLGVGRAMALLALTVVLIGSARRWQVKHEATYDVFLS